MKIFSKIWKVLRWVLLGLFIILAVAAVCFKIYTGNYYRANEETIEDFAGSYSTVHSYSDDNGTVFIPTEDEIKAVIVFYPGGKVEYTAYSPLMYELADRGYLCLLPRMPENLAFLRIDAVDKLTAGWDEEAATVEHLDWYLAGHSLGGVAASVYLGEDDSYRGLILCGSYTATDFSESDIRLLSIFGEKDGVISRENYEESKTFWPEDSEEYVIEGGIHSYFGSYGIQDGDGEPGITNEQQITETADVISHWIG